jgi:hypothetical protein
MQVAKSIAVVVSILFIGSGVYQLVLMTPRPATLGVALVVSGVSILYRRSWGYYIAYLAAFSCLLPPQRISLIPVASSVARFFRLSVGMEQELVYVLISVLFAGVLGWLQYVLRRANVLDRPMHLHTSRETTRFALLLSLALIFFPAINFVYQLILDPPGPGGPAAPGGGLRAFYAVYRSWPFVLVGLIGTTVCLVIRNHQSNTEKAE